LNNPFSHNTYYRIPEPDSSADNEHIKTTLLVCVSQISNEESQFLKNILSATKLDDAEIHIATYSSLEDVHSKMQYVTFSCCIVFGVEPSALWPNIKAPLNHILQFEKGQIVFTPSLKRLQTDISAKKNLWAVIRQLFLTP
jgi:DNA polymerase III psi subunit